MIFWKLHTNCWKKYSPLRVFLNFFSNWDHGQGQDLQKTMLKSLTISTLFLQGCPFLYMPRLSETQKLQHPLIEWYSSVFKALWHISHFTLTALWYWQVILPIFYKIGETETQGGWVICPKSQDQQEQEQTQVHASRLWSSDTPFCPYGLPS